MITRLIIKNFKSIRELDMKLGSINALIGPNNSGKSNIMAALDLVLGEKWPTHRSFDKKDFHDHVTSNPIRIDVRFDSPLQTYPNPSGFSLEFDYDSCSYMAVDESGTTLSYPSGTAVRVKNEMKDEVSLMYLGLDRQAYQQIKATKWTVFGKLLQHIEKNMEEAKKTAFRSDIENAYDSNIAPDLRGFIDDTKAFVTEQTGLDLDFRFSTLDPSEALKNLRPYIKEEGIPIEFDAEDVGAGTQSALAIAIARAYAKIVTQPLVMAMEEPELYLHPHACRHFYRLLYELAENDVQIVYATHERSFVDVGNYQHIHLVRKYGGETHVRSGNELVLPSTETLRVVSKFDEQTNEIFFANHVVLVEGEVDKIACREALMFQGLKLDKENISVIACGGRDNIPDIARVLLHFEIPTCALVDEDPGNAQSQQRNEVIRELVEDDNFFLQEPSLEGLFQLQQKPRKRDALRIFPEWFEQNQVPEVYTELRRRIRRTQNPPVNLMRA